MTRNRNRNKVEQKTDDALAVALGKETESRPEKTEAEVPAAAEPTPETPETPEGAAPETPEEAEAPTAERTAMDSYAALEQLIMTSQPEGEARDKALADLRKLFQKSEPERWQEFDHEIKDRLEELITELVEKYELKPKAQVIEITFPDGEPKYSRGLVGSKSRNGGGGGKGRDGFPKQWGKAQCGDQVESSPTKLAETLGIQVNGAGVSYSDMVDVFDSQGHNVLELPKGEKLDELLARQKDPERRKRLEGLAGNIFRVA